MKQSNYRHNSSVPEDKDLAISQLWNNKNILEERIRTLEGLVLTKDKMSIKRIEEFMATLIRSVIATFSGLILSGNTAKAFLYSDATKQIQSTAAPTNGQILIGSTGAVPVIGSITGTTNRVTVTPGAGTIALTTPQDTHTAAIPVFAGLGLNCTPAQGVLDVLQSTASTWAGRIRSNGTGGTSYGIEIDASTTNTTELCLRLMERTGNTELFSVNGKGEGTLLSKITATSATIGGTESVKIKTYSRTLTAADIAHSDAHFDFTVANSKAIDVTRAKVREKSGCIYLISDAGQVKDATALITSDTAATVSWTGSAAENDIVSLAIIEAV